MKKIFGLGIILLSSSFALAMPAVGDYAKMAGTETDPDTGKVVPYIFIQEVTSYDSVKDEYTVATNHILNGTSNTDEDQIQAIDMLSHDKIKSELATCSADGGTIEKIKVKAGTFSTCKYDLTGDGSLLSWGADVPFGSVKEIVDGLFTLELVEYRFGN